MTVRDFASSTYQRKKVAANKIKAQRKPLDPGKYLRPIRKIAPGFVAAALVCSTIYIGCRALSKATFFHLETIEVSSAKHLSRDEILAIADVKPGRDLLRLNLRRMGEQLGSNPWVETVRIHRYFPDKLSISITEREPLAVVNMGYIYYLDKKGVVFKALNQGDRLNYPVITGFSEEYLSSDPTGAAEALKNTCELLHILREKGPAILADMSEIHYDKGYGFTLYTASGALPVKIGSEEFSSKIGRFARIYGELMAQRPSLHYIDIDYNDKIVVKKS